MNHSPFSQPESSQVLLTPPSGFSLLRDLKNISFKADDIFLTTLSQAQKLIEATPLAFPNNKALLVRYSEKMNLHIEGVSHAIERFEVLNPTSVRRMQHETNRTILTIQSGSDAPQFTVTIHHSVAEAPGSYTYSNRTTSPWREPDRSSSFSRNTEGGSARTGEG